MTVRDLGPWLLKQSAFQEQLSEVTLTSVRRQFSAILSVADSASSGVVDWSRLLLSASLLAECQEGNCQDAALRIAQACLEDESMPSDRHDVAATVLDKLSNRVALDLAEHRLTLRPNLIERLPIPLRLEWQRHSLENSVDASGDTFFLNKFQKRFWDAIESSSRVSASAPTAAGKSFVLVTWISDFVVEKPKAIILYLVPTRALIHEIENKLKQRFVRHENTSVSVTSVPSPSELAPDKANVLVVTQERVQILFSQQPDLVVDAVIVDEAHKVGDGQRGVLLQQVLELIERTSPEAKFIFSSPLTSNPEILLADVDVGRGVAPVSSNDVTVNQNLIWAQQVRNKPSHWTASALIEGEPQLLGGFTLANVPTSESKRLAFVAFSMAGNSPGNLVYANGPASAEKSAAHLGRLLENTSDRVERELIDLSNLIKRIVHKEYSLAAVVENAAAFHYGNMPLILRTEIERLFSQNIIKYLVCTSTLVEGVNLSCRNIFLRGPQKGRGQLMTPEDFWNLAGRAGRWGSEFQGNVICVDPTQQRIWGSDGAPRRRSAYAIKRTADEVIGNPADLLKFIREGTPREDARRRPDLEFVTSYLVSQHFQLGSVLKAKWAARLSAGAVADVAAAIASVASTLEVPASIISRNPGISPIALDSLLAYFRTTDNSLEDLVPVHPSSEDAVQSYVKIFGRIQKTLGGNLAPVRAIGFWRALLVVEWMRGYPLSRLISSRIARADRSDAGERLSALIRGVLEDVEQIARFEAPRLLSAYSDVLGFHLEGIGRTDIKEAVPDIGLLLEFGASQRTQISLMSLGLSRSSAIELADLVLRDDLSREEAAAWLASQEWRTGDLPPAIVREIEAILEFSTRLAGPSAKA
jgi:hypothetical protein